MVDSNIVFLFAVVTLSGRFVLDGLCRSCSKCFLIRDAFPRSPNIEHAEELLSTLSKRRFLLKFSSCIGDLQEHVCCRGLLLREEKQYLNRPDLDSLRICFIFFLLLD